MTFDDEDTVIVEMPRYFYVRDFGYFENKAGQKCTCGLYLNKAMIRHSGDCKIFEANGFEKQRETPLSLYPPPDAEAVEPPLRLASAHFLRAALTAMALLSIVLFTSACSQKGINATLFLREKDETLNNLKGEACIESGQQVIEAPDGTHYRMIHYYSNCDVRKNRKMEEFEPKQWGVKPKNKLEISR